MRAPITLRLARSIRRRRRKAGPPSGQPWSHGLPGSSIGRLSRLAGSTTTTPPPSLRLVRTPSRWFARSTTPSIRPRRPPAPRADRDPAGGGSPMTDVTVTLNGKPRRVADGVTLLDLLTQLDVQPSRVVIEHNREIRRRDDFAKTVVRAGDELELVYFVGGGSPTGG